MPPFPKLIPKSAGPTPTPKTTTPLLVVSVSPTGFKSRMIPWLLGLRRIELLSWMLENRSTSADPGLSKRHCPKTNSPAPDTRSLAFDTVRYACFLDLQFFARPKRTSWRFSWTGCIKRAAWICPITILANISNHPEAIFPPVLMDQGAGRMDFFFARRVYAPTIISRIIGRKQ